MASFRLVYFVLCGLLCGCAAIPAQQAPSVCPSVVNYTPAEEAQIYAELMALPPDSILHKVADEDYHLRQIAKACRS